MTCSDVVGEKDAEQGRHSTPLAGGCGRAVWQQRAPPPRKSMTQTEVACMGHASGGLVGGQQSSE